MSGLTAALAKRGLLLAALLLVAACASPDRPTVQPDEVVMATPMQSFSVAVASAVSDIDAALAPVGVELGTPTAVYRPSEPESLIQMPRVVQRAGLSDPDDGYVVIYDAGSSSTAGQRADDMADYVSSGFGQTNYSADTQFAVSVLGETVIFTHWSPRRSDDADRAEAVFDAIAGVGTPIEVTK